MYRYCGIGSRSTPLSVLELMSRFAEIAAFKGHILRTGGADGADRAFEQGCIKGEGKIEIYLPWQGYNAHSNGVVVTKEAIALSSQYHPGWSNCSQGAQKLHGRNSMIILGEELNDPADFVVCWTENGIEKGGTSQGIRIARGFNVPVYNMGLHNPSNIKEMTLGIQSLISV